MIVSYHVIVWYFNYWSTLCIGLSLFRCNVGVYFILGCCTQKRSLWFLANWSPLYHPGISVNSQNIIFVSIFSFLPTLYISMLKLLCNVLLGAILGAVRMVYLKLARYVTGLPESMGSSLNDCEKKSDTLYLVLCWNAHLSRAHVWVWRWGARIKTLAPDYQERESVYKKMSLSLDYPCLQRATVCYSGLTWPCL